MTCSLDYASPRPQSGYRLEESPEAPTLRFPVRPKWHKVVAVTSGSLMALVETARIFLPLWFYYQFKSIWKTLPPTPNLTPLTPPPVSAYVLPAIVAILFWLLLGYEIIKARRTPVAARLQICDGNLIYSKEVLLRLRIRKWPVSSIRAIDAKPVADIFRRNAGSWLYVTFDRRKIKRWRLNTRDRELPNRVVAAFRKAASLPDASE